MSKKNLRILINTNAPWSISGYGQQAAELLPRIKNYGCELGVIDFYGLEGGKIMLDGMIHYPKINHIYGSDAMYLHGNDFKPDVTMSLQDVWVLNPEDLKKVKNWIPLVPIDHEPAPKIVLERLQYAYRIITYSQFGQQELKDKGLNSTYIPHTVDTKIFKPMDKKQRKLAANLPPDSFIWGMVAANKDNPPRKSFQEVMEAFAVFLQKYPNSYLYLHTFPDFPGGFPIKEFANFLGITDKVLYPDPYAMQFMIKKEQMAMIYNTMDVLLMPSTGEGFGVPAIEAQSCGIPVVTNDFTSMPELIINHVTGELCKVAHKRFDAIASYQAIPSAESIYDSVVRIKNSDRVEMAKDARKHIIKNYDTEVVFKEKWIPFLEMLEKELLA